MHYAWMCICKKCIYVNKHQNYYQKLEGGGEKTPWGLYCYTGNYKKPKLNQIPVLALFVFKNTRILVLNPLCFFQCNMLTVQSPANLLAWRKEAEDKRGTSVGFGQWEWGLGLCVSFDAYSLGRHNSSRYIHSKGVGPC